MSGTTSSENHQRAKGPFVSACNGDIESVSSIQSAIAGNLLPRQQVLAAKQLTAFLLLYR